MSLNINWIELLTNFLKFTEEEIDAHNTQMGDYIGKHHKENREDIGITILGYNAGHHSQFELIIDNDDIESKVMTQRSFLPDIEQMFLKLKSREDSSKSILSHNCFEEYVPTMNSRVRFTLMAIDSGVKFIQSDVF
ncbi:hypothetical protein DWB61_17415 [Ancylomarina euxinus]|uniref:Uncharacterized protein n=1 Tax=Ancylomarina euxinus TaxID=2283627 RepID=A0A425XWG1_9BACT|nr:hypothetical protein [Ancylomarina euxinus]MCZ4696441.1 hypothetical protein [Ancylomarina euxinus]RRG18982.1 hypothetical protein DWB61_17415 [Ancylomarina euxinus]